MNALQPPRGSRIQVRRERNGVTLWWKKPDGGPARYVAILFLCFWLCGWVAGMFYVGREFLSKGRADTFTIIWLIGWGIGGLFAGHALFMLLRPKKPESITLQRNRIVYDTGTPGPAFIPNQPGMGAGASYAGNAFPSLSSKRRVYEFSRSECPEFVLEGVGAAQRLRFDDGADRVVIGECLREPEREWLAEVLRAWRENPSSML